MIQQTPSLSAYAAGRGGVSCFGYLRIVFRTFGICSIFFADADVVFQDAAEGDGGTAVAAADLIHSLFQTLPLAGVFDLLRRLEQGELVAAGFVEAAGGDGDGGI